VRGVVLAGGSGTRLFPATRAVSKQLLPVFDKPLIYYPLSVLLLCDIVDILVISTPSDEALFRRLLGDGSQWGLSFEYAVQDRPRGLADAFRVGRSFIGTDDVALILGDNIFYGHGLAGLLDDAVREHDGATLFGYRVRDPERYGVASLDDDGRLVDIVEKPVAPASNLAITGLYLYDNQVVDIAKELQPSERGELEITDVNLAYLRQGRARLLDLGRGTAWLDTGTSDSLLEAAHFVQTLTHRQGIRIACIEEIAFRLGRIDAAQLAKLGDELGNSGYGAYVRELAASV
jgi:glucose-1-phosphate thymidylyltransferase